MSGIRVWYFETSQFTLVARDMLLCYIYTVMAQGKRAIKWLTSGDLLVGDSAFVILCLVSPKHWENQVCFIFLDRITFLLVMINYIFSLKTSLRTISFKQLISTFAGASGTLISLVKSIRNWVSLTELSNYLFIV